MTRVGGKIQKYFSTIPGVNDMPLPYIVRAQAAPDSTTDFQGEFIDDTIACVTLSGAHL